MIRTEICGTSILCTSYEVIQVYFEMMDFPVAPTIKNLSAMLETWLRSLGWENSLEKGMATHSSILFFFFSLQYSCLENPMDGEPGGLQSWGPKDLDMTEWLLLLLIWNDIVQVSVHAHTSIHTHVHTHTLRLTFCSLLNDHFSLKRKLYRLDTEMYNSILGWMWSHLLHIFIFKPLRIVWWMPGNHFKGVITLNCFT